MCLNIYRSNKELSYSDVDLLLENNASLEDGASVFIYNKIDCSKWIFIRRKGLSEEFDGSIEYIKNSKIDNPSNGTVLVIDKVFDITLSSVVPKWEQTAWQIFANNGLKVISSTTHNKTDNHYKIITQKFTLERLNDYNLAHLQFWCSSRKLLNGMKYNIKGDLLNIFVSGKGHHPLPPVVSICPLNKETWIPLLRGQILQIILPYESKILNNSNKGIIKFLYYKKSLVGNYKYFYFQCLEPISDLRKIDFKFKQSIGNIFIPEIDRNHPVIVYPNDNFTLFSNGFDVFIFRTEKTIDRSYLDKGQHFKVESSSARYFATQSFYDTTVKLLNNKKHSWRFLNFNDTVNCQAS